MEVSFSEEDENMVLDKIKNIVKEIESENFYLKPRDYNSCKYCEFKIFVKNIMVSQFKLSKEQQNVIFGNEKLKE